MTTSGTTRSSTPVRRIGGPLTQRSQSPGAAARRRPRRPAAAATSSRDRPPGQLARGSARSHGTRTKARSRRARMRQRQLGIVAAHVVDGDDVDVQRARAPTHLAGAAGGLLGGVGARRASPRRRRRRRRRHDRVQVVVLRHRSPRRGLVHRRHGDQPRAQRVDRVLQVRQPVAEIRPDRQHRPCSSALLRDRDGDVGELQRDRRLRLVHGHRRRRHARVGQAHVGQPLGQRLEQVRPARRRRPRRARCASSP